MYINELEKNNQAFSIKEARQLILNFFISHAENMEEREFMYTFVPGIIDGLLVKYNDRKDKKLTREEVVDIFKYIDKTLTSSKINLETERK